MSLTIYYAEPSEEGESVKGDVQMSIPELPTAEEKGSLAGDLLGMFNFFIDPGAAAKLIKHKLFWIGPLVLISVVTVVVTMATLPFIIHVIEVAPPPPNTDPAAYQKSLPTIIGFYRIVPFLTPIFVVIFSLIATLVLFGTTAVMQIKAKFVWLFNLIMGCGLINMLQSIATYFVLRGKGEVETQAELQPPLGLDIFMPESMNKMLLAFVGFFTPFMIWYIVMFVLIFAIAFKVSKGKAVAAITPMIVILLLLKLVGAAFQR